MWRLVVAVLVPASLTGDLMIGGLKTGGEVLPFGLPASSIQV